MAGETKVAFPQMATGEAGALDRLRLLPGFEVGHELDGEWPLHVLADACALTFAMVMGLAWKCACCGTTGAV
jgi:hypothetical protein